MTKPWWGAPGVGALLFLIAAPTAATKAAPPASIEALKRLEKGVWEVRERSARQKDDQPLARLCLGDPMKLMQVWHRNSKTPCSHFVILNEPNRAIITYQCEGNGTGRTDLRVETPRLVQIQTQGVADGAPFELPLEGRWGGSCR